MKELIKKYSVFGLVFIVIEIGWFPTIGKTWIQSQGCNVYINGKYEGKSKKVTINEKHQ